jgi:BNR repeat-like domain
MQNSRRPSTMSTSAKNRSYILTIALPQFAATTAARRGSYNKVTCMSFKSTSLQANIKLGRVLAIFALTALYLNNFVALRAQEPGKFPGLLSQEFIYQVAPFPECHASTIAATKGGLVAAWFGGTEERDPDVGIWVSRHDGNSWSKPVEWANGIQYEGKRYPCWNPVLFQAPADGPLLLFFKVGPTPSSWWGELIISHDQGRTFGERRRLPEGIDGPVRCKPMLLPDQTLLCGSSTEPKSNSMRFSPLFCHIPTVNCKSCVARAKA